MKKKKQFSTTVELLILWLLKWWKCYLSKTNRSKDIHNKQGLQNFRVFYSAVGSQFITFESYLLLLSEMGHSGLGFLKADN